MKEKAKLRPTTLRTVNETNIDLAIKESQNPYYRHYQDAHTPAVVDECPNSENARHHYLLEPGYVGSLTVGRCLNCGQPWPLERGKLESIPQTSGERHAEEYLKYL